MPLGIFKNGIHRQIVPPWIRLGSIVIGAPVAPMRRRIRRAVAAEHAREAALETGKPHVAAAVALDLVDKIIGQPSVEYVHAREQLARGVIVTDPTQPEVAPVIVDPDVAVRPGRSHCAEGVRHRQIRPGMFVNHFVNLSVPHGDVNHPISVLANPGDGNVAAQLRPILPG